MLTNRWCATVQREPLTPFYRTNSRSFAFYRAQCWPDAEDTAGETKAPLRSVIEIRLQSMRKPLASVRLLGELAADTLRFRSYSCMLLSHNYPQLSCSGWAGAPNFETVFTNIPLQLQPDAHVKLS
jgi:hypothetical protein